MLFCPAVLQSLDRSIALKHLIPAGTYGDVCLTLMSCACANIVCQHSATSKNIRRCHQRCVLSSIWKILAKTTTATATTKVLGTNFRLIYKKANRRSRMLVVIVRQFGSIERLGLVHCNAMGKRHSHVQCGKFQCVCRDVTCANCDVCRGKPITLEEFASSEEKAERELKDGKNSKDEKGKDEKDRDEKDAKEIKDGAKPKAPVKQSACICKICVCNCKRVPLPVCFVDVCILMCG